MAKARNREPLEVLIPSDEELKLERRKLRKFEPWDTKELLSEAQARKDQYSTKDEAIRALRNERKHQELIELLKLLEIDPSEKNAGWKAFIKLAEIHHDVGRLVYRWPQSKAHAQVWIPWDEFELLYWVNELVRTGLSEREAVNTVADNEVFPYEERFDPERRPGRPSQVARRNALRKKYQRIKPAQASLYESMSLERAMGTVPDSALEAYLSSLVTDWFLKTSSGDKQTRTKSRISKSPPS